MGENRTKFEPNEYVVFYKLNGLSRELVKIIRAKSATEAVKKLQEKETDFAFLNNIKKIS